MLITRETDYAIRILRALTGGKQMTAPDICKKELLPQQFIYKILKKLQRSGLIAITRGKDGGCRLIADLQTVTLYDLMKIMESDKSISACTRPDYQCAWRQKYGKPCRVHQNLQQIQDKLDEELKSAQLSKILSSDEFR